MSDDEINPFEISIDMINAGTRAYRSFDHSEGMPEDLVWQILWDAFAIARTNYELKKEIRPLLSPLGGSDQATSSNIVRRK